MQDVPLETLNKMMKMVPQMAALEIDVVKMETGRAIMRLPFSKDLVAYKDTGVMAGGAIFTLLDSVLGAAVFSALDKLMPVSTLDLRVDYLKPATTGRAVFANAHCYKVTRKVAFVRGVAYHDDEADPIAHASATFIIDRPEDREVPA